MSEKRDPSTGSDPVPLDLVKRTLLSEKPLCPVSGQKGKPVGLQTIKAVLLTSLRTLKEAQYFFCPDSACEVVYFTADGTQTITTAQLREPVFQKQPHNPEVLVCYCFQHRLGELVNGSVEEARAVVEDIRQGITAGQCACDLRNPQGTCCLGNITGLVKAAFKDVV
jgi:hypothetical protein